MIRKLTQKFRIRHSLSSLYHPQSNGLMKRFNKTLCEGIAKVTEEIESWDKYIQLILFAYQTKELRILKQSSYKLVYRRESSLVMNYGLYEGIIIERLLEITDKVSQLREIVRRTIRKTQTELDRKFEGKPQRIF